MKKTLLFFGLIAFALFAVFVSADVGETNFTAHSGAEDTGLSIVQLRYEPYPVNPGEYFDMYIKVQQGVGFSSDVTFELVPEFPFFLDSNEDPVREYGKIYSEPIVLHYKVRVSDDAVEGTNELNLRYTTGARGWIVKEFDIEVADAQTDFDLVVQESTDSEVSIAIANTGKNTANSLIVRIPDQNDFRVSGTNGQMVGNLDSGDYSIVSFSLAPLQGGDGMLTVQMDYTDSIGERRTVLKDVQFRSGASTGNFTMTGDLAARFATIQEQDQGIFSSVWTWIVLVVVAVVVIYFYRKHKVSCKSKAKSESGEAPDWVVSRKKKKR